MSDTPPADNNGKPSDKVADGDTITLRLRLVTGTFHTITVGANASISELMATVHKATGIEPAFQRLVWQGNLLKEDRTLGDYGTCPDATRIRWPHMRAVVPAACSWCSLDASAALRYVTETSIHRAVGCHPCCRAGVAAGIKDGHTIVTPARLPAGASATPPAAAAAPASADASAGTDGKELTLKVRLSTGDMHTIRVAPDAPLSDVMRAIEKPTGIPVDAQRVVWRGRILKEDKTLADYGAPPWWSLLAMGRLYVRVCWHCMH